MKDLDLATLRDPTVQTLKSNFYSQKIFSSGRPSNFYAAHILSAQDDAWNLFAGALRQFIAGGSEWANLQLVAPAQIEEKLGWDDPVFGDYYFHKITSDLINGPGATYNKTDKSFADRYGAFLEDVYRPPIDTDAQKQMIAANTALNTDRDRHNELIDNLNLEWMAFDIRQRNSVPPSLWQSFDAWWAIHAQPQIQDSQKIVLSYFMNFEYWVQRTFGGGERLAQMLLSYQDDKKLISVKIP